MSISILFSVAIYYTATDEVGYRLDHFRNNITIIQRPLNGNRDVFLLDEKSEASANIIMGLFWQNVFILIGGGLLSYLLAKRTMKTIEEAHEAQTRFTSDASHELRTPLAAIKTEIEVVLHDKKSTKEDFESTLRSNLEEVDRLTTLSNMLLNLSRIDNKGLIRSKLNAFDTAQDAINTFGDKAKNVENNIDKNYFIIGDQVATQNLISLLIDNALKYSPKKSKIIVSYTEKDKQSQIAITNQGNIDAKSLPHIFDRFYRSDKSRNAEGFGLGLSLAKKIAEANHGYLSVDTTKTDQVSFVITLQRA